MDEQYKKYKVLIVDDSAFMRKVIKTILDSDDEIEVIDSANDGQQALNILETKKPDVVTLDIEMPVMDGMECLRNIMDKYNIPVIMLSSHTRLGAEYTIEALECGAIDFITKPEDIMEMNNSDRRQELIEKVKIAARINREFNRINQGRYITEDDVEEKKLKKIVAIGSSTGGPKALKYIIGKLPQDFPAAVLVVQHMPAGFTKSLAVRLNNSSKILVKEAEDQEKIKNGCVYIAPGGFHMIVFKKGNDFRVRLTKDPPVAKLRPTIDKMMISTVDSGIEFIIGVILTGMGGDGSKGIRYIKEVNKGYIIAQDEESSTVFGMPHAAIKTGVVDEIIPIEKIADVIIKKVGREN